MGFNGRKPVFRVWDLVRLKPVCSATETSRDIEILNEANIAKVFIVSKE